MLGRRAWRRWRWPSSPRASSLGEAPLVSYPASLPAIEMKTAPTCLRCARVISPEHTVELHGDRLVHLDCRRPRRLGREERALLYQYCWSHVVGACVSCARPRYNELLLGLFGDGTDLCPHCRKDLTDVVRTHLYSCALLPAEVRCRAQDARAAAQKFAKHSGQLRDRADVLMREAEIALAALREAMTQATSEALRRTIRVKLLDGKLPHDDISATILQARLGDGSACGVCDHIVASSDVMMVVVRHSPAPHEAPIPFHTACFELWNDERRTFTPSP
jgi:hypothetical protein